MKTEKPFRPRIERAFKGHWLIADGRRLASGKTLLSALWCYVTSFEL